MRKVEKKEGDPVKQPVYAKIKALAEQEDAVARSVEYVHNNLCQFLKKNERVLICFPKKDDACCSILERAVLACEAVPVWLETDRRWITILKTAFTQKINCIIAPPLMMLGLSKVAKHMGTPLFARNVLLSGYPSPKWLVDAVEKGLDCKAWGCYDPGVGAVISGFSCRNRFGVHIRDDEYGIDIVDNQGNEIPDGEEGNILVYPKSDPMLRLFTGDTGKIDRTPCSCGCSSPRLVDMDSFKADCAALSAVGESLHMWSSILDCRLEKGECGLELEAVVFQGEKLPKFPSCAKMVIRPWKPDEDLPFDHHVVLKNMFLKGFDH